MHGIPERDLVVRKEQMREWENENGKLFLSVRTWHVRQLSPAGDEAKEE